MLSASTISSSSSAYSSNAGMSTPSQYSSDSRRGNGNPLTELIGTEQSYIETLKMIDSQIAPIWMKQMTSAAPDFSELLKYIHDILKVNKRFCLKLNKIASNPQAISELGDVLMQWVNDFEVPYANYSRSYIPNLNQRSDILRNASIHSLLANLSANVSYDINLETLFNSPLQQLKYYKGLYNRLLEGTDSGRADHKLLLSANKRIDMVMAMAKSNTPNKPVANKMMDNNILPPIQTNFSAPSDLTTFERQIDCSRTVDLYGGAQINYQLNIANPGIQLVMRDNFIMLPTEANGSTVKAHLLLTTEALVVCRELSSNRYLLIYPAIPIGDITVKAESIDRELVGEYIIRFSVLGKKHIIMRADSKEIRNTWIGVDLDSSNAAITTPRTLSVAAQKKMLSSGIGNNKYAAIELQLTGVGNMNMNKNTDIYSCYSEEEGPKKSGKSRDTIMDIYDNHFFESDDEAVPVPVPAVVNINPQSVKILPHVPNVPQAQHFFNSGAIPTHTPNKDKPNVKQGLPPIPPNKQQPSVSPPVKDFSHVQMTYIQAPTAQMSSMSISPPIPAKNESKFISFPLNNNLHSPSSSSSSPDRSIGIKSNMNDSKPSSPRAIEVQRAVIPEVMQAVTQKTDEYISDNRMQIPRTSSIRASPQNQGPPPRNQSSQQQQQQRPMQQNGYPPNPQSRQMTPQQQQQQQRPPQHYQQQHHHQQHQQQHQQRPGPPSQAVSYNNSRPIPSPTLSPNVSSNTARRPPPGGQPSSSPRLQQPAGRFISPSPSMNNLQAHGSSEELNSPPDSPNAYNTGNDIRQVLYSNSQCDVFHWNNQSWYAADGQCLLQVKVTHSNRACVAVQLQNTGQLYLNAWVLPTTVIRTPSPTDVSLSVYMGTKKENYLIHFAHPQDANVFANILRNAHAQSNQPPPPLPMMHEPEHEEPELEPVDNVNVPQTLKPVMQCKAKLFIQNETSNWSTFGSVTMRISQQAPSMRMLIQIENDKSKLVSAVVRSGNVEMITAKRISFLLLDEVQKTSIVYMIHLREEQTGNKIFEYLRTKNAENGW
ncbi:hypothetical protein HPULCUR_008864 [Helicostylum pulchrum]|uniref:DH domain-containing protein n=1 Tax=Helicostylum pulchrum TaxID=562976 RepID=A0ABP9Y8T0_9FUNG